MQLLSSFSSLFGSFDLLTHFFLLLFPPFFRVFFFLAREGAVLLVDINENGQI